MEEQKVSMYLMANQDKFPTEKIMFLREKLEGLDERKYPMLSTIELKNPTVNLVISILLGSLGIDRFMIGDIGMGILKLLTAGCCGILTIIDWFIISKRTKELNFNKIMTLL